MKTTKARKRKRAAAVACTELLADIFIQKPHGSVSPLLIEGGKPPVPLLKRKPSSFASVPPLIVTIPNPGNCDGHHETEEPEIIPMPLTENHCAHSH
jgi:hypothetical protein